MCRSVTLSKKELNYKYFPMTFARLIRTTIRKTSVSSCVLAKSCGEKEEDQKNHV